MSAPLPICSLCGVVIGAYEPLRAEHGCGEVSGGSLLTLDADALATARRLWHEACFVRDILC